MSQFELPLTRDKKFQVMVANSEKIACVGQCQAHTLTIQGYVVTADYYVLPIAACQLVLGVQWLETLGPIETDYKKLTVLQSSWSFTYLPRLETLKCYSSYGQGILQCTRHRVSSQN